MPPPKTHPETEMRETFLGIVQEGLSAGYLEMDVKEGETGRDELEAAIIDIARRVREAKGLYARVKSPSAPGSGFTG